MRTHTHALLRPAGTWSQISIIAADIQETVGCAIGISILSNGKIPLYGGCIIASGAAYLLLYFDRLGFRYIEAVYASLVAIEVRACGDAVWLRPHMPRSWRPKCVHMR